MEWLRQLGQHSKTILQRFGRWAKAQLQWLGLLEQDSVSQEPASQEVTPEYITCESGFRYRLLPLEPSDGYETAKQQLRPGERLYRIHYDVLQDGRGFPVLIGSPAAFSEACQRWSDWKVAAGIPVQRPVPVE